MLSPLGKDPHAGRHLAESADRGSDKRRCRVISVIHESSVARIGAKDYTRRHRGVLLRDELTRERERDNLMFANPQKINIPKSTTKTAASST
jgi:hypothetical protein